MSREKQVLHRLQAIEQLLHDTGLWQASAPPREAFNSQQPFSVDTMAPLQWLQWIFLPRMYALLDSGSTLPVKLAIAPYYEVALQEDIFGRAELLRTLTQLDLLFEQDD